MINRTRNTKNRILAIPTALAAREVKPKRAATRAMIKKAKDQDNIGPPIYMNEKLNKKYNY
jgi:hypothetical protein